MSYRVDEIRKMAVETNPRIAVWCANGKGTKGNPGYMANVTIALLADGVERKPRACEHSPEDFVSVAYFSAWRGMVSATRRLRETLESMR